MDDEDGWQISFDQAECAVVRMFHDGRAILTLEEPNGEIGVWEFRGFPVDDFMDAGLNLVGPWLNKRGLAYNAWQETAPGEQTAIVFRYNGPDVDPRIVARRLS